MATSNETRKEDRSNDEPVLLKAYHKIFLSHSGAQKEFVDQLCVDLERCRRSPFYDKRPSSLPKGERFPDLIKDAVAQCEMMVVVVSEEYFTSKWPMIELNGFVQASKGKNNLKKILPLFYGLTVDELFDSDRQQKWFKTWETMATADNRIKVDEWKESLKGLHPFNGLVYDQHSQEVVAYREEIVSNICKAIPSDNPYDESHVQGRSKLCQVIRGYLENIPNSTKFPGVRVIGLYGMGGMGKTQICKMMCNEMDGDFVGKVCHVELGEQSKHTLVKTVLTTLTNTREEIVQGVEEDKCEGVLLNKKNWNKKSFLTIDNVWDDSDSLEQGKLYLRAPFFEGSWVIITSRFKQTLISLQVDENACFEMPKLDKDDARKMFLYHATNGKEFEKRDDLVAIEECVNDCYFSKGEGRDSHYHPLSLKALGIFLQYHGGKEPSAWTKDLQNLKESSYSREPRNRLFEILRLNFDRLPKWEQELFMDVALFSPGSTVYCKADRMEWLCLVHNKKKEKIEDGLKHLMESALLEHVEMTSRDALFEYNSGMRSREVSNIHDLYCEFARLEAQGNLKGLNMNERRWVYGRAMMEGDPRSWKKFLRVCISETSESGIRGVSGIEWKYCKNLVVLKLDGLSELSGVLNFKDLNGLRSLTMVTRSRLEFSIEGLEGLETLTYFQMQHGYGVGKAYVGKLPAALKVLVVSGPVEFVRDVLALCTNLVSLEMRGVRTSVLDLKSCTSLEKVVLDAIEGLKVLDLAPSLQALHIYSCSELIDICGLDRLLGLVALKLCGIPNFSKLSNLSGLKRLHTLYFHDLDIDEFPGLDGLVGLRSLTISYCRRLSKLPCLIGLHYLRELTIKGLRMMTAIPHLNGLEQLEDVDASCNFKLINMQGFRDLRALKSIDLYRCESLSWLPDMRHLTNLKFLNLTETQVGFHHENIYMLRRFAAMGTQVHVKTHWPELLDLRTPFPEPLGWFEIESAFICVCAESELVAEPDIGRPRPWVLGGHGCDMGGHGWAWVRYYCSWVGVGGHGAGRSMMLEGNDVFGKEYS